jgi:hypothetical protein
MCQACFRCVNGVARGLHVAGICSHLQGLADALWARLAMTNCDAAHGEMLTALTGSSGRPWAVLLGGPQRGRSRGCPGCPARQGPARGAPPTRQRSPEPARGPRGWFCAPFWNLVVKLGWVAMGRYSHSGGWACPYRCSAPLVPPPNGIMACVPSHADGTTFDGRRSCSPEPC